MSGFTVHVLESTMDYLNDQESKFLYSVKAREIRRTQHLPLCRFWGLQWFVFADHAAYNYKAGWGYTMQDKCVRCPYKLQAEK